MTFHSTNWFVIQSFTLVKSIYCSVFSCFSFITPDPKVKFVFWELFYFSCSALFCQSWTAKTSHLTGWCLGEAVHLSLTGQLWKKYIVADFVAHTARSPFRSSQRIHRVLNTTAKVKLCKRHTMMTKTGTDTQRCGKACVFLVPATIPVVMYISVMELVKAEVIVPRLIRKPPIMTTGR